MKIGIVINRLEPTAGGAFTFKNGIIQEVAKIDSEYEFVVLDAASEPANFELELPYIHLRSSYTPITDTPNSDSKLRVSSERGSAFNWIAKLLRRRQAPSASTLALSVSDYLNWAVKDAGLSLLWFVDQMRAEVRIPFLFTVFDLQHRVQPWFPEVSWHQNTWKYRETMYDYMLKRASVVVTGTERGKREIETCYGIFSENIEVIPLPAPKSLGDLTRGTPIEVAEKYDLLPDFILYPAQFWPHKNHINLLLALKILGTSRNYFPKLVLVGSDHGNLSYVKATATTLGLQDQVKFPGFVPNEELAKLYLAAESLVFVSFFGPDNLPPLEAFSLGCPVIASKVPGASEQLGEAVLYVDPRSPPEIAEAIWTLHTDQQRRENMKDLGFDVLKGRSHSQYVTKILGRIQGFDSIFRNWDQPCQGNSEQ